MTAPALTDYPARLSIDYPDRPLNRLSTFLRILYVIPIAIVIGWLTMGNADWAELLFVPLILMIVVRHKYPRWWFDFILEFNRFSTRVCAYLLLMSDGYPSTDEEQYVHLDLDYPDAEQELNRWLPLVKWFLAIPHLVVLIFLGVGALLAGIVAWFAILFTGRYPRPIFNYIEGVLRWVLRVQAYAAILITDRYPPFRLA